MDLLNSVKKPHLLCCLCVSLVLFLGGWLWRIQDVAVIPLPFSNNSIIQQNVSRNVTVLLWHSPFGFPINLQGDICWNLYQIPHCRLVADHSFYNTADVVVFHNRELIQGVQKLPLHLPRPQGQRWVWFSVESPAHNSNLKPFANVFNLTMNYRRDADISIPYGVLVPKKTGENESGVEDGVPLNKTSLVCWVVSNYQSHHKRTQVYHELQAIVPVNVYGRTRRRPLSSKALLPTISRCYFYLAFENSIAKDYITEKLWRNSYLGGAVPVVLGPSLSDYRAVAPPHPFIHVDEFASVKDLGEYLKQLAEDKKRYNDYFSWKQQWKVGLHRDCKICSVYDSLPQHKVYSDLHAWDHYSDP